MADPQEDAIRAAHPDLFGSGYGGDELGGAVVPAQGAAQEPSLWDRLKSFATSPTVLKTAGTMGALALAPETGGLSIPAMLAAGGSVAGGLASKIANGEHDSLGDVGMDALEGAATPLGGTLMRGVAKPLKYVGEAIGPWGRRTLDAAVGLGHSVGGGSVLGSGVEGGIAEALFNPKLIPRGLEEAGNLLDRGVNAVRGSARSLMGLDEALPAVKGVSREVPYNYKPTDWSGSVKPHMPAPSIGEAAAESGAGEDANRIMNEALRPEVPDTRTIGNTDPSMNWGQYEKPVTPAPTIQEGASGSMQGLDRAIGDEGPFGANKAIRREAADYVTERNAGVRGTEADVPDNPVAHDLEAERQAIHPPEGTTGGRQGDMHLRDTTGSKFGFPDLPKISEDELVRLQQLFQRVTGR